METRDYIPAENFTKWYELLKASGNGRLQCDPFAGKDEILVFYTFDDMDSYKEFRENYKTLTTPIKETKRGRWKRIKSWIGI